MWLLSIFIMSAQGVYPHRFHRSIEEPTVEEVRYICSRDRYHQLCIDSENSSSSSSSEVVDHDYDSDFTADDDNIDNIENNEYEEEEEIEEESDEDEFKGDDDNADFIEDYEEDPVEKELTAIPKAKITYEQLKALIKALMRLLPIYPPNTDVDNEIPEPETPDLENSR